MRQKKEEFSFLDCLFFLLPLFDKFFFLEREGKKGRDGPVFLFVCFFPPRFFGLEEKFKRRDDRSIVSSFEGTPPH